MRERQRFYRAVKGLTFLVPFAALLWLMPARIVDAGADRVIQVLRINFGDALRDKDQILITEIVDDFLAQSIDELAWLEGSAFYFVERSRERVPKSRSDYDRLVEQYQEEGVHYLVLPELEISDKGYVLRVATLDLGGDTKGAYFPWRNRVSLDKALIDSNADFSQIEEKIVLVARRVFSRISTDRALGAQRVRTSELESIKTVLFSCITPIDRDDSELEGLSRYLTIQMPFYLADAVKKRGSSLEIIGLSPKEYFFECLRRASDFRQEQPVSSADAVITADLLRSQDRKIEISFLLSIRGTPVNRPSIVERFQNESRRELRRLADLLVADLTSSEPEIDLSSDYTRFIVLKNANVRATPSAQAKVIGKLFGGDDVDVVGISSDPSWYEVRLRGDRVGYVFAPLLRQR